MKIYFNYKNLFLILISFLITSVVVYFLLNKESPPTEESISLESIRDGYIINTNNYALYKPVKILGEGGISTVILCKDEGGDYVIIKETIIDDRGYAKQEADIHTSLHHPSIISCYDTFVYKKCVYLVLEWFVGCSLDEYIRENGHFSEEEAKDIIRQILGGLEYLHLEKKIIHRDLKLENILINPKKEIRIIDFGYSVRVLPEEKKNTLVVTPYYIPPEFYNKSEVSYSFEVDLWHLGVILYLLVKEDALRDDITPILIKIEEDPSLSILRVTGECKDLIRRLVQFRPEKRMRIEDVSRHPWFVVN